MTVSLFSDVVVNGETTPSAAIAAEAQNHNAPRDKPGIAWRKAAQARGLVADPEELARGRVETEDEAPAIAPITEATAPAL